MSGLSEDGPVEVRSTDVAAILFLSHPYMQGCYQQPYNSSHTVLSHDVRLSLSVVIFPEMWVI